MIQDIAPHRYDNAYAPAAPAADDLVLAYAPAQVLARTQDDTLVLPRARDFSGPLRYAFSIDGAPFFLADALPEPLPEGFRLQPTRPLRTAGPQETAWAIGVGESLWRWYGETRFCGRCGAPMRDSTQERARVCPECGLIRYPKICPAVITAVTDGDRLLLTRYANRPFRSYALVAGFNEIGESIEDTVAREVAEETGLKVRNLRFYRSQPWVFTDSLLMGFYADLDGDDTVTLQRDELAEAAWFDRSELPTDHSPISLTGEMIELFRTGGEPRR